MTSLIDIRLTVFENNVGYCYTTECPKESDELRIIWESPKFTDLFAEYSCKPEHSLKKLLHIDDDNEFTSLRDDSWVKLREGLQNSAIIPLFDTMLKTE